MKIARVRSRVLSLSIVFQIVIAMPGAARAGETLMIGSEETGAPLLPFQAGVTDAPAPSGNKIVLRRVILKNSTVIDARRVDEIAAPYLGKLAGIGELTRILEDLNRVYAESGYVTSEVILPSEEIVDGVVVFEAIERGADLDLSGLRRLNEDYLRSRLEVVLAAPLKVRNVENALTLLRQNPLFIDIRADLIPNF
jgi:hemolysin activation/secretion protein